MSTTQLATAPQAQIVKPSREVRIVEDTGPLAYLFDTSRFEHMFRIATAMAAASLIPKHLRGNDPDQARANCFLVVNQAIRWGMDPFAVAPETYEVSGKLAYQGKLIAAVVNARAGLDGRLKYDFNGTKGQDNFTITVSGQFQGDPEPSVINLSVKDGKTQNQMWVKDPEQKLVYSGVVKWARRFCPEIVLGVVTEDDIDRMNERASLPEKPKSKRPDFSNTTTSEIKQWEGGEKVVPASEPVEAVVETEKAPEPAGDSHTEPAAGGSGETSERPLPAFVPTNNNERLSLALRDMGIAQGPFMQGLHKLNPKVSKNWTTIPQLPEEIATEIIESGLDDILDMIRKKGVLL